MRGSGAGIASLRSMTPGFRGFLRIESASGMSVRESGTYDRFAPGPGRHLRYIPGERFPWQGGSAVELRYDPRTDTAIGVQGGPQCSKYFVPPHPHRLRSRAVEASPAATGRRPRRAGTWRQVGGETTRHPVSRTFHGVEWNWPGAFAAGAGHPPVVPAEARTTFKRIFRWVTTTRHGGRR